jgi:TusA-related sulfurtransferase
VAPNAAPGSVLAVIADDIAKTPRSVSRFASPQPTLHERSFPSDPVSSP